MVDVSTNQVLRRQWFAVAPSPQVQDRPVAVRLLGSPFVLFRTQNGQVAALPDACSHNGSPLSIGRVADGCIVCPHHGWTFDGDGHCLTPPVEIAGRVFPRPPIPPAASVENDGLVWVCPEPDAPGPVVDWALPTLPSDRQLLGSMLGHLPASPLAVMAALLELSDHRWVDTPHPFAARFVVSGDVDEVVVVVPADAAESVLISLRPGGRSGPSPAGRLRVGSLRSSQEVFRAAPVGGPSTAVVSWQRRMAALLAGASAD